MRYRGLALFAGVVAALWSAGVRAEPLPRPNVDFVAEGTMTSGKGSHPATVRHGAGKMRVDTEFDGYRSAIYIDLPTHAATVVTERMGQKIALQIDRERASEAVNILDRNARRAGEAKVAGETCAEYEFETAKGRTVRTCITDDGIALRMRDMTRKRVTWEAAHVTRAPQDAALFVVPPDALAVQVPKLR